MRSTEIRVARQLLGHRKDAGKHRSGVSTGASTIDPPLGRGRQALRVRCP